MTKQQVLDLVQENLRFIHLLEKLLTNQRYLFQAYLNLF
jgi:hypothetical protein